MSRAVRLAPALLLVVAVGCGSSDGSVVTSDTAAASTDADHNGTPDDNPAPRDDPRPGDDGGDEIDLSGTAFTFTDPALPDSNVSIRFSDDDVRWSAGCNGHEGMYEVSEQTLDYVFNTSDLGDCVETEAYEVFDDLLRESPRVAIDEAGRLVLTGAAQVLTGEPIGES